MLLKHPTSFSGVPFRYIASFQHDYVENEELFVKRNRTPDSKVPGPSIACPQAEQGFDYEMQ